MDPLCGPDRITFIAPPKHQGKSTTEFVKRDMLDEVRQQLANYARFRKLTNEWVDLSVRTAKLRKTQSRR